MFKQKYKRSEWFEGLLEAEELYKQGYVLSYSVPPTLFFRGCTDSDRQAISGNFNKRWGVYSYIIHRECNPELFQETLDEQL